MSVLQSPKYVSLCRWPWPCQSKEYKKFGNTNLPLCGRSDNMCLQKTTTSLRKAKKTFQKLKEERGKSKR